MANDLKDANYSNLQSNTAPPQTCQSINWYAEGEGRVVEVDGVRMVVRYLCRNGRKARIMIEMPGGAEIRDSI